MIEKIIDGNGAYTIEANGTTTTVFKETGRHYLKKIEAWAQEPGNHIEPEVNVVLTADQNPIQAGGPGAMVAVEWADEHNPAPAAVDVAVGDLVETMSLPASIPISGGSECTVLVSASGPGVRAEALIIEVEAA